MSNSPELGSNSSQPSPLFFSLSSYTRFHYQDLNPTVSSNNPDHGSNSSKPSSAKLFFSLKSYSRFRRSESLQTSSSASDSTPYSRTSSIDSSAPPPLLRDTSNSAEAQIAAAAALSNPASDPDHASLIVKVRAVPVSESPVRLQTRVASYNPIAKGKFAMENAFRSLVSLQSFELPEVGEQVHDLFDKLRSAVRIATAESPPPYDRPIRHIFAEADKNLERALALVRRCKRSGVLRRGVTITTDSTDFRKVVSLLNASLGDLHWLLSVYDSTATGVPSTGTTGNVLSLPPIASTDPILSWVWSNIATVQKCGAASASDRTEAAKSLACLALDNDRNKKIIVEEGGLPPLLSLLRDASNSVEAQIAAAAALTNLASDPEHVSLIVRVRAVPVIVNVLSDSPMRLQTRVAGLVSRMASYDPIAQEEFAMENAIRPLVSLLSFEVPLEDSKPAPKNHTSIHSLVQGMSGASHPSDSSSGAGIGHVVGRWSSNSMPRDHHHHRNERENESPEVKLQLKVACAEALWMLAKGSVSNSRKITETKGLRCLSKIVEKEKGELQYDCLVTLMEITAVAESNEDLRRSVFKTNSPAAKSVIDQLLSLAIQQGSTPGLQIAAIKSIGSLAKTFPARETRVLTLLVSQLEHWNPEVAAEAAMALGKFVNPDNFLRMEHSKAIIEFGAVPLLLRLIRSREKTQLPSLILLCFLALHVPNSDALERVFGILEAVARTAVAQHPSLRELLPQAIYHLELYRIGAHSHKPSSIP